MHLNRVVCFNFLIYHLIWEIFKNPHVLHTQTRMNIIFRHVGSIRPLKNKLYSDEIKHDFEITITRFNYIKKLTGNKVYS